MSPRENENNAYANFWDDNERALWYVMVFSGVVNLVLTRQIYSEETNGAHAHYREPVPLTKRRGPQKLGEFQSEVFCT